MNRNFSNSSPLLCNTAAPLPLSRARRAFTLLQLVIAIAFMAILATILLPVFARSRESARRAQCDTRLKSIALALDAFRQEHSHYPKTLAELQTGDYLNDPDALRCPNDPRKPGEGGYAEYYVLRSARDANDLPVLVCPFHEEFGMGAQAYKGRYTTQFAVKPARLTMARNITIHRPGKEPIAGAVGMQVRGGDRITVGSGTDGTDLASGDAVIEFADGSTASLQGGSDLTVLQSFQLGTPSAPLYTLLKQAVGRVTYRVNHGSPFDVATPTATAGARGTEFIVVVASDGETDLYVESGVVHFSTLTQTLVAPIGQTVEGLLNGLINLLG